MTTLSVHNILEIPMKNQFKDDPNVYLNQQQTMMGLF